MANSVPAWLERPPDCLFAVLSGVHEFPSWPVRWRIHCYDDDFGLGVITIECPGQPVKDLWFASKSDTCRAIAYLAEHGIKTSRDLGKVTDAELLRLAYESLAW